MRVLQVLVVAMGILIVAGIAWLGAVIVGRMSHRGLAPAPMFSAAPVAIPPGARVEALSAGGGRLVVGLALADGDRRILILDLATGKPLGSIELRAAR